MSGAGPELPAAPETEDRRACARTCRAPARPRTSMWFGTAACRIRMSPCSPEPPTAWSRVSAGAKEVCPRPPGPLAPLLSSPRSSSLLSCLFCPRLRLHAASSGRSDREDDQPGGLPGPERPPPERRQPRERVREGGREWAEVEAVAWETKVCLV